MNRFDDQFKLHLRLFVSDSGQLRVQGIETGRMRRELSKPATVVGLNLSAHIIYVTHNNSAAR